MNCASEWIIPESRYEEREIDSSAAEVGQGYDIRLCNIHSVTSILQSTILSLATHSHPS